MFVHIFKTWYGGFLAIRSEFPIIEAQTLSSFVTSLKSAGVQMGTLTFWNRGDIRKAGKLEADEIEKLLKNMEP